MLKDIYLSEIKIDVAFENISRTNIDTNWWTYTVSFEGRKTRKNNSMSVKNNYLILDIPTSIYEL